MKLRGGRKNQLTQRDNREAKIMFHGYLMCQVILDRSSLNLVQSRNVMNVGQCCLWLQNG